jgi:hypothetical protein
VISFREPGIEARNMRLDMFQGRRKVHAARVGKASIKSRLSQSVVQWIFVPFARAGLVESHSAMPPSRVPTPSSNPSY